MSPDLLAFLFLVTSTALVLGVAVVLRGLYALVSDPSPRLPEGPTGDPSGNDAGSSPSLETGPGVPGPAGRAMNTSRAPISSLSRPAISSSRVRRSVSLAIALILDLVTTSRPAGSASVRPP